MVIWRYGTNMVMTKVTFTLDELAVSRLQDASARLARPKSEVVREAILEFHDRMGKLSERERVSMLRAFDELVPKISGGAATKVEKELSEIREGRRTGGRRKRR